MTDEQRIVYVNSQIACALIEMEGMKTENMQRQNCNQTLAYTEKDFTNLIVKYDLGHNDVLSEILGR